jgi:hypothetical protein
MSKPLFRLNVTSAQTALLLQLLTRSVVGAADAGDLGALYAQVRQAQKHWNLPDPAPAAPLPPPA